MYGEGLILTTAFTLMCDIENIVGKGSTAFYKHELSLCNKRRGCKDSIYTELVLTLSSIYTCFNTMKKKTLRKHCGKR